LGCDRGASIPHDPQVPFVRSSAAVGRPPSYPTRVAEPPEVLVMPVTHRAGRRLWEITVVIMSIERVDLWFLFLTVLVDKAVGFFFLRSLGSPGT
jgi:hypothetical protein